MLPYLAEKDKAPAAGEFDPFYAWHTFYGSGSTDYGSAIALDGQGNIYVTGWSEATWSGPGGQSPLHTHSGGSDLMLIKLDLKAKTLTNLVSRPNPSVLNQAVTFTVTVTSTLGIIPTGVVTYTIDGTSVVTRTLNSHGLAIYTESGLSAGKHTMFAGYESNGSFGSSKTGELVQTVYYRVLLPLVIRW